jgi:protein-disulfide isomerase
MNKTLIWIVAIVVLLLGGMSAVRLAKKDTKVESTELSVPVGEGDHKKGEGKVVLVEYSDFQCPACATYEPALKQLFTDLPGQFTLVYRHFPLRQSHLNAQLAAQASEAANLQGKFWEMHDVLFAKQNEWAPVSNPTPLFISYAGSIGLDTEKFTDDIGSDVVKAKVNTDFVGGQQARVNSTPTFFLDGKKLSNPRNYEEFRSVIEAAVPPGLTENE